MSSPSRDRYPSGQRFVTKPFNRAWAYLEIIDFITNLIGENAIKFYQ